MEIYNSPTIDVLKRNLVVYTVSIFVLFSHSNLHSLVFSVFSLFSLPYIIPTFNTYGAREADNYSIEVDSVTYKDWYLPSNDEAIVMWDSGVVTAFKTGYNTGNNTGKYYMMISTGYPPFDSYFMDNEGYINSYNRFGGSESYIIPVRNF